jgi:hypothetical protein
MNDLEQAIAYHERKVKALKSAMPCDGCPIDECSDEHRQLVEWLKELKIHREIHEILLQMLLDSDIDICCDDLMDDAEEKKKCEENCNNKSMNCWVRWAKLKARERSESK